MYFIEIKSIPYAFTLEGQSAWLCLSVTCHNRDYCCLTPPPLFSLSFVLAFCSTIVLSPCKFLIVDQQFFHIYHKNKQDVTGHGIARFNFGPKGRQCGAFRQEEWEFQEPRGHPLHHRTSLDYFIQKGLPTGTLGVNII